MCGIMSGMSEAVCCDDMKVELYGTVFTIRQSPCWLGDAAMYTETLKLQVNADGAFLVGTREGLAPQSKSARSRFKVPYEWARELRGELRRMRLPACPDFFVGCDGGYMELSVKEDGCRALYRWWGDAPSGWEELDRFARRLIFIFEIMCEMEDRADGVAPELALVCPVAGISHCECVAHLTMEIGVGDWLELVREADNVHDPNAIAVMVRGGARIGYIPRRCNGAVASGMDSGRMFTAKVVSIDAEGAVPKVDIAVFAEPG